MNAIPQSSQAAAYRRLADVNPVGDNYAARCICLTGF
jgi:hypothetical protein